MTDVFRMKERPSFGSGRLATVCGKAWCEFFVRLSKERDLNPSLRFDRALWVTAPYSASVGVRPGSTSVFEAAPDFWVPAFSVRFLIDGFAEHVRKRTQGRPEQEANALIDVLYDEFVNWANPAIRRAWDFSKVQHAFSRFNPTNHPFIAFSTRHDEGLKDSTLTRLCRNRPGRKSPTSKRNTSKRRKKA